MIKRILFALFYVTVTFILAGPTYAASVNLQWDPVTARVDGTPITGLKYAVHQGSVVGGPYTVHFDAGTATILTVNGLVGGQKYCFVATAYTGPFSAPAETSANSNEVCTTIALSPIAPPQNLRLPSAAVSAGPSTFGMVLLNRAPEHKHVSIKNVTKQPFTVVSLDVQGEDAGSFVADTELPYQVNPGKAATVEAYFKPERLGWHEAALVIGTDQGEFVYTLTGNGSRAR